MKFKRLLAGLIAPMMISVTAAAEPNEELSYLDLLANYAANLYIDSSVTSEDLIMSALDEVLRDNPELMYQMIKECFKSLDPYTEFYTAEEYKQYYRHLNKVFYGMGVVIQRKNDNVTVIRVYEGSGAEQAGMAVGDVLLEVDGTDVSELPLDAITALAAGEEGTMLSVKVLRDNNEIPMDVERRKVEEATLSAGILPSDIGYIELASFAESTPSEFAQALEEFDEKGIDKIILDLRYNPGGLLTSVVSIAQMIVPEGVIAQTMYRNEDENETFYSSLKDTKYKFVVLVNDDTASAAEVLTGALKDSKAGYIIGTTTFGKGVIQNVFTLPTGEAFKITTGHYLTRDGYDINGTGIEPDEYIENSVHRIDLSKYAEFDDKTKWYPGDSGEGVLAAKQRLSVMGFYSGEIDDVFDEGLERAVYNFQESVNLYPYGVLDFSTQATMQNKFYVIDVESDDQFFAAYEYLGGNKADLE